MGIGVGEGGGVWVWQGTAYLTLINIGGMCFEEEFVVKFYFSVGLVVGSFATTRCVRIFLPSCSRFKIYY